MADITWIGLGTTDYWSTTANWDLGRAPVSGDSVHFAGSTRTSPINDLGTNAIDIIGITFDPGAAPFTVTGDEVEITSGVHNGSSAVQTLDMSVYFTTSGYFSSIASGSALKITQPRNGGSFYIEGTVIFAADDYVLTSDIDITGASSDFQIGDGGTVGLLPNVPVTTLDGGTLAFKRSDDVTTPASITGYGNIVQRGSGVLTVTGASISSGSLLVEAGKLNVSDTLPGVDAHAIAGMLTGVGSVNDVVVDATGSIRPGNNGFGVTSVATCDLYGTLSLTLDGSSPYDGFLSASSGFTIESGAHLAVVSIVNSYIGKVYTVATTPTTGTFAGLADMDTFTAGTRILQIKYDDSGSITLTDIGGSVGSDTSPMMAFF